MLRKSEGGGHKEKIQRDLDFVQPPRTSSTFWPLLQECHAQRALSPALWHSSATLGHLKNSVYLLLWRCGCPRKLWDARCERVVPSGEKILFFHCEIFLWGLPEVFGEIFA
jgi:hypothetical protein